MHSSAPNYFPNLFSKFHPNCSPSKTSCSLAPKLPPPMLTSWTSTAYLTFVGTFYPNLFCYLVCLPLGNLKK